HDCTLTLAGDGLLRRELGAAVDEDGPGGLILDGEGYISAEHEVRGERDEAEAARTAQPRDLRAGLDVASPRQIRLRLAAIGIGQGGAVKDRVRPRGLDRAFQRA